MLTVRVRNIRKLMKILDDFARDEIPKIIQRAVEDAMKPPKRRRLKRRQSP